MSEYVYRVVDQFGVIQGTCVVRSRAAAEKLKDSLEAWELELDGSPDFHVQAAKVDWYDLESP